MGRITTVPRGELLGWLRDGVLEDGSEGRTSATGRTFSRDRCEGTARHEVGLGGRSSPRGTSSGDGQMENVTAARAGFPAGNFPGQEPKPLAVTRRPTDAAGPIP